MSDSGHSITIADVPPDANRRRLLDFYDFATNAEGRKIKLGGGNFATVWKGVSKSNGEEVAIKIVVKQDASGALSAEANPLHAEILMMLNHKNIIQLKDYFDEEKALCLVLELATGGDIVEKVSSEETFSGAAAVQFADRSS
jgi:serine/threonine protein kinase